MTLTPTSNLRHRLLRAVAVLGLVALAGLAGATLGHGWGYRTAKAEGDAALAKLQATRADARAAVAEETTQSLAREVNRNNQLAQQLADERRQHATEKQTLLKRIANVTTVYIPVPGAAPEPLPRSVFTAGFVREYNAALGLGLGSDLSAAAGNVAAAGTDAAPGAAQTAGAGLRGQFADLRDSGLGQADILAHVADYGERCRNLESQLNRLLDRLPGAAHGHR